MKKTIKLFITAVFLFAASLSTYAQFESNREPSRFHMGLRAGLSSSTLAGDGVSNFKALQFFTGGLAFDVQLAPVPIFLGFGVNYLKERYIDREVFYWIPQNYYDDLRYGLYYHDVSAIHVPLVLGYHINLAPNFFLSPYVGGFSSYCIDDVGKDNRLNYGLRVGVGLNFGRLTFDAAYDFGLKNLGKSDYKIRTRTLFLTLGVNLAGKR